MMFLWVDVEVCMYKIYMLDLFGDISLTLSLYCSDILVVSTREIHHSDGARITGSRTLIKGQAIMEPEYFQ